MEVISAGGGSWTEEQRFAISSAEALTNLCEVKCVEAEEKGATATWSAGSLCVTG